MKALARTTILIASTLSLAALVGCASTAEPDGASAAADSTNPGVCTPAEANAKLQAMLNQPITPLHIAGFDFTNGLTIDAANAQSCAATEVGEDQENGGPLDIVAGWGLDPKAPLVEVEYVQSTGKIDFIELNPGYNGTIDFVSRPTSLSDPKQVNPFGQHVYQIAPGKPLLRDGMPWAFDWTDASTSTELFDAMMYTFAPTKPSTQTDCRVEQSCLSMMIDGEGGVFGVRPLGLYFHTPEAQPGDAKGSTPDYLYAFPSHVTN